MKKAVSAANPVKIILGDALSGLKQVETSDVQVCATSPPFCLLRSSLVDLETRQGEGTVMPEPTRDRPSRNYEFLFLFSKKPDYRFDRTMIDVPARKSYRAGDRANAGSVWETKILADSDPGPDGLWRVNQEASRYPHVAMWPKALVREMLLPTVREGDTVLDPFAGTGTTGEVAVGLGCKAILIESSELAQIALQDRIGRCTQPSLFP